ncbi:MarR family winged helix-turn-helix transcriptional regulator [Curtobacterium sp. L1-20]|uniref:MarR family winged helix-turn-helix transcriptional regulator n=1 Tax=Curtobacterium sp. L1-20 TaxID=3138181 RepID=UPI003B51B123
MPGDLPVTRDDIDTIAAWTVIRAARELARRLAVELGPLDLSPVEFGVLVQLAAADGLSQADLARAVGIRPQSMTTLVAALHGRGLVDRGTERGRGRASRITLTTAGGELLARAHPLVLASNDWFGDQGAVALVTALRPLLADTTGPADTLP